MIRPEHKWLHDVFDRFGVEWYYVGGCVRDTVRGVEPKDWDIATNAKPEHVERMFVESDYCVARTGEGFGGVTLINNVMGPEYARIECTTYRSDGVYSDRRHPDTITFAKTIQEDLARRDFAMNAMAMDPKTGEIIDPYDGQDDIEHEFIRCVGVAADRFNEDPLRILRAARFEAQTGFDIHPTTYGAMKTMGHLVEVLPGERVRDEIMKAMAGRFPSCFWRAVAECNVLKVISPELHALEGLQQPSAYHQFDAFMHSAQTLLALKSTDPLLRFVALHHDIGKKATFALKDDGEPTFPNHEGVGAEMISLLMERLKFSNGEIERAKTLVNLHLLPYDGRWGKGTIRRWLEKAGPWWDDLILLRKADLIAHGARDSAKMRYKLVMELDEKVKQMRAEGETIIPQLAITGHDVMRLRGVEGREVGRIIKALREVVIDDPSKNTREFLEEQVKVV